MTVLLAFAFVSGIVTIISPCVLPVLPIVLSGGVTGGKLRPIGVLLGFMASFAVFTLTLTALVQTIGVSPDVLRVVSVVIIVAFGIVMLVPSFAVAFEALASKLSAPRPRMRGENSDPKVRATSGFWGGLTVGASLGLVWTPCVGPIMASVISLALTRHLDGGAVWITLAYAAGTCIPIVAVMLGGRALLTRVPLLAHNTGIIQKVFAILMILAGVVIGLGWDRRFQTAILAAFPHYGSGVTAIETAALVQQALAARTLSPPSSTKTALAPANSIVFAGATGPASKQEPLADFGLAPEFVTKGRWFNTPSSAALTLTDLRGKVIVVDFWTYSCVNCVRTLPHLAALYRTYASRGLVVIGVHTPEFEFEKNPANVAAAIKELGVDWPVVQDNEYTQWNAYGNQYWPAHYFIDGKGHVRYYHFGEGDYTDSEQVLQKLLAESGGTPASNSDTTTNGTDVNANSPPTPARTMQTGETYLGSARGKSAASSMSEAQGEVATYRPLQLTANGEWSLSGRWTIAEHYIAPESPGSLDLKFDAKNVFLVIEPRGTQARIDVQLDGRTPADTFDVKGGVVRPHQSRLYQLIALDQAGSHLLRIHVEGKVRLFAFTFG